MALADIQRSNMIEQLINNSLQSGQYPDLDALRADVLSWQNLGQPTTQAVSVNPGSVSSSTVYNDFFTSVGNDLACLYEQAWELFNDERNSFIALSNQEDALSSNLAELLGTNNTCIGDQFISFANIDLTNTTASIDLATQEVVLSNSMALESMDLSGAVVTFTVSSPYTTVEILSAVSNVLNTAEDQYWLSCVHEPTQSAITSQLTVDLGSIFTCNKVAISFQGTAPSSIVLNVSPDNGTWTTCTTISPGTWFFPASGVRYLQFTMTKMPDENQGSDYLTYFGMSNFAVYYMGFIETGDLVSKPWPVTDQIINQIDLVTNVQTPPLTSIDTYVNFDDGPWMPIDSSLSLQGGTSQAATAVTSTAQDSIGGITLYELGPGANAGSLWQPQLVVGQDKYLKMRTYIDPTLVVNNTPTLSIWQSISPYTRVTSYNTKTVLVDTATYPNVADPSHDDNLFFYQFYVNMSGQQQWVNITCSSGYTYCLYLNGALIQVAGSKALLNFMDGVNEITLILFASSTQVDTAWSWDWNLTSQIIFANQNPFILVDYPILLYHTPPGVNNYFALQQVGEYWMPVINFNYVNYGLDISDFVLNYQVPNAPLDYMRFKATLSRQAGAGSTTPILSSYQITLN